MFLIQFTDGIGTLRFNPNPKFYSMFLGCRNQTIHSIRQLPFVHHPIAQWRMVIIPRILVTEPTVVHNKQLTAHCSKVSHHLVHFLLVNVKIDTFPTIQQNVTKLITTMNLTVTCPTMKITAYATQPFFTIREGKFRGYENFLWFQFIFGCFIIDSCQEVMRIIIIRINTKFVISTPTQGGSNHTPRIFLRTPIQREHNLRMVSLTIACSIHILYCFHARLQWLGSNIWFCNPAPVQMRNPYVSSADRHTSRIKPFQDNRFLFGMGDLRPHLDDIWVIIGFVVHLHFKRIVFIS